MSNAPDELRPEIAKKRPLPSVSTVGYQRPLFIDTFVAHCCVIGSNMNAVDRPLNGSYWSVPPATMSMPSDANDCPAQKRSKGWPAVFVGVIGWTNVPVCTSQTALPLG